MPNTPAQARESFNRRFWNGERGYLYDVVDGENGDDPACRPNQLFAISLAVPGARRNVVGSRSSKWSQNSAHPRGPALAQPGPSGLQSAIFRRPPRPRCRLSPGHRLGLAHRPVHRCLAQVHPEDRAGARSFSTGSSRIWTKAASARSAKSSMRNRRSRRAAASPRPGAWPKSCELPGEDGLAESSLYSYFRVPFIEKSHPERLSAHIR